MKKRSRGVFKKTNNLKAMYDISPFHSDKAESVYGFEWDDEISVKIKAIDELYKQSLIMQAIDVPIRDMTTNWMDFTSEKLKSITEEFKLRILIMQSGITARKYGRVLLFPVFIYGETKRKVPVSMTMDSILERKAAGENIQLLKIIQLKHFTDSEEKVTDIFSEDFGKPIEYVLIGKEREYRIKASRCIPMYANNAQVSTIESIYSQWCDFFIRNRETTRAVKESNWILLSTDFNELVEWAAAKVKVTSTSGSDPDLIIEELIRDRLNNLRNAAHNNGAYAIDKTGEDIKQISKTNIKSMVESCDSSLDVLTAAVDIPMERYLGKTVVGLGDGNGDTIYIQTLAGLREIMYLEPLDKILTLLQTFNEGVESITYEWLPNPIEVILAEAAALELASNTTPDTTTTT